MRTVAKKLSRKEWADVRNNIESPNGYTSGYYLLHAEAYMRDSDGKPDASLVMRRYQSGSDYSVHSYIHESGSIRDGHYFNDFVKAMEFYNSHLAKKQKAAHFK